jgi:hypothetical protein
VKRTAPSLSNHGLSRALHLAVGSENTAIATVLDHIAEFDARKLYRPAAYPSMFAYCVGELHLSEDAAYKRIQAARAAQRFPAIFDAVIEGRLHLSAVCLLAPYLTEETAADLLAAARHKTKVEIEKLLAERFPRPNMPARVEALLPPSRASAAEPVPPAGGALQLVPEPARLDAPVELAPGQVGTVLVPPPAPDRSRVQPLGPQRYGIEFTMSQTAHDKLRYAQDLLGHQVAAGDIAAVFEKALDALIPELEKQKFAATAKPRPGRPDSSKGSRHIPARVKCAVWKRDQGQCTFVSEAGKRCTARKGLQFDHVQEFARGGEASLDGIRLLCWAHNQYAAERTFGEGFMRHKRTAAGNK